MEQPFEIVDQRVKTYPRFNASGTEITVRLKPPYEPRASLVPERQTPSEPDTPAIAEAVNQRTDPINYFVDSVDALFEHVLSNVEASDMVGITIRNVENEADKPIGFSFRRRDQIASDVIWALLEKVGQSNERFNALDKLVINVQIVKMPTGFGKTALKTKGRP